MMAWIAAATIVVGCEQYHPTAPAHIRPASERDRDFAAKVGSETSARKVFNTVETRASGIVDPMLDERPGLEVWRLSVVGPVAVAEGVLDGRAFAGVYWTRDDRVIRKREMVGSTLADPEAFAPKGRSRMRAPGDTRILRSAYDLVSGKARARERVRFRDAASGRDDGGVTALRQALGDGKAIEDAWCIDDVVAVLAEDALWVLSFDELEMTEVSRYPR
jgi:hypothetical protein